MRMRRQAKTSYILVRMSLQVTYLRKDLYPEYILNPHILKERKLAT